MQYINEVLKAYPEDIFIINDNKTYFTKEELALRKKIIFTPLDNKQRPHEAFAALQKKSYKFHKYRKELKVFPVGFNQHYYAHIPNNYLYNRCHIIGFAFSGQNNNKLNIFTGTQHLNHDLMLPIEKCICDLVYKQNRVIIYKVNLLYNLNDIIPREILMQFQDPQDFATQACLLLQNTQPHVSIDYATGQSHLDLR